MYTFRYGAEQAGWEIDPDPCLAETAAVTSLQSQLPTDTEQERCAQRTAQSSRCVHVSSIQKCILECMVRICGVNFYWCLVQMRSWYGMLDTMSWFTMFVHVITWTFMNMLSAVFPQVAQRSKPELFCVLWPAKVSRYPCVTEPLTLEQVSPCVHVQCRFVKINLILNLSHSR